MWLLRRAAEEPVPVVGGVEAVTSERWKVRCFGRLRIYRNDGSQVAWDIPGGTIRKTKALFAYLLQKGGQGPTPMISPNFSGQMRKHPERGEIACATRSAASNRRSTAARVTAAEERLRDGARYVLASPTELARYLDRSSNCDSSPHAHPHRRKGRSTKLPLGGETVSTPAICRRYSGRYADDASTTGARRSATAAEMYFNVQRDAARIHRERQEFGGPRPLSKSARDRSACKQRMTNDADFAARDSTRRSIASSRFM